MIRLLRSRYVLRIVQYEDVLYSQYVLSEPCEPGAARKPAWTIHMTHSWHSPVPFNSHFNWNWFVFTVTVWYFLALPMLYVNEILSIGVSRFFDFVDQYKWREFHLPNTALNLLWALFSGTFPVWPKLTRTPAPLFYPRLHAGLFGGAHFFRLFGAPPIGLL